MKDDSTYTQQYNVMGDKSTVVQGQFISASIYNNDAQFPEVTRGSIQPSKFNDVLWTVLFAAHLITIGYLSIMYIPQAVNIHATGGNRMLFDNNAFDSFKKTLMGQGFFNKFSSSYRLLDEDQVEEAVDYTVRSILSVVLISGICGFVLSIASLSFIMNFAEGLIKTGIIFQSLSGVVMAVSGLMLGAIELLISGLIFAFFTICFAWACWSRIPFAASNLVTATTAVRSNSGLTFFAHVSVLVTIGWFVWWSITSYATILIVSDCDAQGNCNNDVSGFVAFLFVLSLYWTSQIIKNVVHVTVAGTVGTWWWSPQEANGCCSSAIRASHSRATTYSFGSICLGSLVVAIVQTFKQILHQMRESDDGILLCIAECCLGILESILELFNSLAFVYVGIYGYSFIDAAKSVLNLFKERGWTTIINDNLTSYVLILVSFFVGLIVGGISALISFSVGLHIEGAAFLIGLLIGTVLTQIIMSLVGSAVDTVIVCYAEDPSAFQANHPELSERMRDSWREAHPEHFKY